ncbi:hypothetical protein H310_09280 [Aphanomyces invadans]|uniref:Flavin reductase like domain-containing protein n=1 Tax=Aphanomyces invadans TaxID=157072 RepID=A0A024TUY8_9STRA|nr:hypothetical protein H310_09280 [Aphanomyces invadans]ETV97975.1 hypothetical protein H310_09280 [Aphanomyces invadans]|eukprot:XP_008873536.1 hypothetical protein H310_09280 [Aphanomyces invadans]
MEDDNHALPRHVIRIDRNMLSRVLYPNPVCLLSVADPLSNTRNVMTVTWLTPINNHGKFICSINCHRHTATFLNQVGRTFVLNVPTVQQQALVLAIGGCSGSTVDKFASLNIETCDVGWTPPTRPPKRNKHGMSKKDLVEVDVADAAASCVALKDSIAHVLCRVEKVDVDDGHYIITAVELAAYVDARYWNGKTFGSTDAPPYLTFLGSKVFGQVTPLEAFH